MTYSSYPARSSFWTVKLMIVTLLALLLVVVAVVAIQKLRAESAAAPLKSAGSGAVNTAGSALHIESTPPATPGLSSTSTGSSASSVTVNQSSNANGTDTNVSVNGQPVDVPDNGSTMQTVTGPDGQKTTVQITTNQSSNQGSSSNYSSLHVSSHSSSVKVQGGSAD